MFKKAVLLIICLPIAQLSLAAEAHAEGIALTVAGNGEGSQNQVATETQNTTNVTQTNNAQISNDVNTTANTGDNTVSDNTGAETGVTTGNVDNSTVINNENINSNNANTNPCCSPMGTTNVEVSGNGSDSVNSVDVNNLTNTNVSQTNTANISNNINVDANTGRNTADGNNGNVSITTGNIDVLSKINNSNINASIHLGGQIQSTTHAVIKGNGSGSVNIITFNNEQNEEVINLNIADIRNMVMQTLNTGGNTAEDNVGDVAIVTGDIDSEVIIDNKDINRNVAITECVTCEEENPPGEDNPDEEEEDDDDNDNPPVITPTSPQENRVESSKGESGGEKGPAKGEVLPITGGGFSLLFWMTLLLFSIFLTGIYLRFHSGNSPPMVA